MNTHQTSTELARQVQSSLPCRAAEDGPSHIIVRYATGFHERLTHKEARDLLSRWSA
jgi:hypothetical protein